VGAQALFHDGRPRRETDPTTFETLTFQSAAPETFTKLHKLISGLLSTLDWAYSSFRLHHQ
jgi:hypothetical protein